ncbi:MAG: glycosyltransferase family 2 protein [bacterium]|nr:glycosyltransferase family 2 protein [bacterium]
MIQKKISVVVPSYNEEQYILSLYGQLTRILKGVTSRYEIIFVNNGSFDSSDRIFTDLARKDKRVMVICLSRNFGSQNAYSAGLSLAGGDAVVCMDGDLQDPPSLIKDFIQKWQEGYDVVYGVRKKRRGNIIKRIGYKIFYRLLKRFSYIQIPLDAGDFGLMDKKVVAILNAMPEKDRFIRGLRAFSGFKQVGIEYTRNDRTKGEPKYSFLDNFKWAYKGLFSFSYTPLELISLFAFAVGLIAMIGIGYYLYHYFVFKDAPHGFATMITVILFLGAIQLLSISIIGGYISRIFEEVKNRPNYIIEKVLNKQRKK